MSITKDDAGDMWLLQYTGGVTRWDGAEFKHYPLDLDGKALEAFTIYHDREGQLWVGTAAAELFVLLKDSFVPFAP